MKIFNIILYLIKEYLFGFYSSDTRTIKIKQYDNLEYSYQINKDNVFDEIFKMNKYAKNIKIS